MFFTYFIYTYYEYIIYFFLCCFLSSLLLLLCIFIANQNLYYEKNTGYECGFNPFSDARDPFNIKFFLIAILFILFDIELLFFLPWATNISSISYTGFFSMYLFFFTFIFSYIFEWKKNCMNLD